MRITKFSCYYAVVLLEKRSALCYKVRRAIFSDNQYFYRSSVNLMKYANYLIRTSNSHTYHHGIAGCLLVHFEITGRFTGYVEA